MTWLIIHSTPIIDSRKKSDKSSPFGEAEVEVAWEDKAEVEAHEVEHIHTFQKSNAPQKGTYYHIFHSWKCWYLYSHRNHDNIAIQRDIYFHKVRSCSRRSSPQHIGSYNIAIYEENPVAGDMSMAYSGILVPVVLATARFSSEMET